MDDPLDTVYLSSGAFTTRAVPELVDVCLAHGLSHVELGSGMAWSSDMLAPVRTTAGREVHYLVHNYFPPPSEPFVLNLAAADAATLERSRAHCRAALTLSAELCAPFFSVHSGFAFTARPEDLGRDLMRAARHGLDEAETVFVESLRMLCAEARRLGVGLLIENNVVAAFNLVGGRNRLLLGATAEDLLRIRSAVGDPGLGFLVDTGHVKVTARALGFDADAFLDVVADGVRAFHLSDNDGRTDANLAFGDDAWFAPRLADFPRATMIVEAYRLTVDEMRRCADVVRRARAARAA